MSKVLGCRGKEGGGEREEGSTRKEGLRLEAWCLCTDSEREGHAGKHLRCRTVRKNPDGGDLKLTSLFINLKSIKYQDDICR